MPVTQADMAAVEVANKQLEQAIAAAGEHAAVGKATVVNSAGSRVVWVKAEDGTFRAYEVETEVTL